MIRNVHLFLSGFCLNFIYFIFLIEWFNYFIILLIDKIQRVFLVNKIRKGFKKKSKKFRFVGDFPNSRKIGKFLFVSVLFLWKFVSLTERRSFYFLLEGFYFEGLEVKRKWILLCCEKLCCLKNFENNLKVEILFFIIFF